jgi:hypothetical protein
MSEDNAQQVVIEISKVDFKPEFRGSTISGKDKLGAELIFVFRHDTMIRHMSPAEWTRQLGEVLAANGSKLPFQEDEEVLVTWKYDPSTSQKVAIKITILE